MTGEKVPVTAGVCDVDIRRTPIRQHDAIAPDLKDCPDPVIPNIPKIVGLSYREFLQHDLQATDRSAYRKRLGDPRLNRRTSRVSDLELGQRLPGTVLL